MKKRAILGTIGLLGITFVLVMASAFGWHAPLRTLAAGAGVLAVLALAGSLLLGQRQILERIQDLERRSQALDAEVRSAMNEEAVSIQERLDKSVKNAVRHEANGLLWAIDSRLLSMLEDQTIDGESEDGE